MRFVVSHAELPFNHRRNTATGPHFPVKTIRFGPMAQQVRQLLQFGRRQLGWTACVRSRRQGIHPVSFDHVQPLAHGAFAHPQRRCNRL